MNTLSKKISKSLKQCSILLLLLFLTISSMQFGTDLPITSQVSNGGFNSSLMNSDFVPFQTSDLIIDEVLMETLNYSVFTSPDSFDGYTLFNLNRWNNNASTENDHLIIMDMQGEVVAQKYLGSSGTHNCPAEFIDPDTILVGTEWGAAFWHLKNDSLQIFNSIQGHHEYEYNPINETIFTFALNWVDINGTEYLFDYIQEYSLDGTLIWEMDVHDFIPESWWCPLKDTLFAKPDVTHSNTIFFDVEEDIIYYNARNINTFYKINHSTGEILWGLGEYGNFSMYNINGIPTNHLFFHPHAIEKVDDSTFIMYDNDLHNQTVEGERKSRILEIEINETSMTAKEKWQYIAPSNYFSFIWGDADRLPNGNRIGSWGYTAFDPTGLDAAMIEVNSQGEVVWKTAFLEDDIYRYGIYQLERFRWNPTIIFQSNPIRLQKPGSVIWDVWYNYRNKQPLPGNYSLYFEGYKTESGNFSYAKFWNPTSIEIPYGELGLGSYNLTILISDGYGNTASDTVILRIQETIMTPADLAIIILEVGSGATIAVIILIFVRKYYSK